MRLGIEIDVRELVENVTDEMTRSELIQFVKDLDLHQQDWDFTERLYEHFAKLHQEYLVEQAEDEARAAKTQG